MSNMIVSLDYPSICSRFVSAALENQDLPAATEFHRMEKAYLEAAYESGRIRIDNFTMSILNRGASDLYRTTSIMVVFLHRSDAPSMMLSMETTNIWAEGLTFLRTANAAILTARAKAVATKGAAVSDATHAEVSYKTKATTTRPENTPATKATEHPKHATTQPKKAGGRRDLGGYE